MDVLGVVREQRTVIDAIRLSRFQHTGDFGLQRRDKADAVFGSRFLGRHRCYLFTHYLANLFLNLVTNVLYNTTLTDMETCFKAVRGDVLKALRLRSDRFGIEPEITAKLFKRGARVYEVPITYEGRDYAEGKKISWRDGFPALWTLVKYRFVD